MIERILTVKGQLGLHARAAAKLVRVASGFQSRLSIERLDGSATADAKSILSVLMLAAARGTKLRVVADGMMRLKQWLLWMGCSPMHSAKRNNK